MSCQFFVGWERVVGGKVPKAFQRRPKGAVSIYDGVPTPLSSWVACQCLQETEERQPQLSQQEQEACAAPVTSSPQPLPWLQTDSPYRGYEVVRDGWDIGASGD